MDKELTVHPHGTVWIDKGAIAAVTPQGQAAPEGFSDVEPVASGGTIFPGLIVVVSLATVTHFWDQRDDEARQGPDPSPGP